jgi:predicted metal-dependent RNase
LRAPLNNGNCPWAVEITGKEEALKVTLFGAGGGEVTGSAYLVESGNSKVLVDEPREREKALRL